MKLGFVGLGAMGVPMAKNLIEAGHGFAIWNRTGGRDGALVEAGFLISFLSVVLVARQASSPPMASLTSSRSHCSRRARCMVWALSLLTPRPAAATCSMAWFRSSYRAEMTSPGSGSGV